MWQFVRLEYIKLQDIDSQEAARDRLPQIFPISPSYNFMGKSRYISRETSGRLIKDQIKTDRAIDERSACIRDTAHRIAPQVDAPRWG